MRSFVLFVLLLLCAGTGVSAQPPPQFQNGTFCDRYTNALASTLGGNQFNVTAEVNLLTLIITRVVAGGSGNGVTVPGLFAATSPVLDVFQGKVPFRANPIDYTNPANNASLTLLANHLVAFFGTALGCTAPGFPAPSSFVTMQRVHYGMGIDAGDFAYFIQQVVLTAQSFGVAQIDIDTIAAPFLNAFGLCGGVNQICTDPGCPLATVVSDQECEFQSELRRGVQSNTNTLENYIMGSAGVAVAVAVVLAWIGECMWNRSSYRKL